MTGQPILAVLRVGRLFESMSPQGGPFFTRRLLSNSLPGGLAPLSETLVSGILRILT